jgi:Mg/Co/Ni transporter MgtE
MISYVYVTDGEGHLNGVFSLRDLVLARPGTPVTEFMQSRVAAVGLLDSQDDRVVALIALTGILVTTSLFPGVLGG